MKAAITLLSTIALLTAAPTLAQGDGVVHGATGSGQMQVGDGALRTFSFNAVERSDGTATGQAQLVNRQGGNAAQVHVEIDCLSIFGSLAIASGTITQSFNPAAIGLPAVFAVEDNGEGGNDGPDRITLLLTFPLIPPETPLCKLAGPADAEPLLIPIENGNIQVR
jgi:hypothetical protein